MNTGKQKRDTAFTLLALVVVLGLHITWAVGIFSFEEYTANILAILALVVVYNG